MKGHSPFKNPSSPSPLKERGIKGVRLKMIEIYVGTTQNLSTNLGGWGVVLIDEEGHRQKCNGSEQGATPNQMALRAAIEGLSRIEQGCEAKIFSNNQYLVLGIEDSRQRRANRDLWNELDELLGRRHVHAEYMAKHKWLGEAQMLAKDAAGG